MHTVRQSAQTMWTHYLYRSITSGRGKAGIYRSHAANLRPIILDKQLKPLPIGVAGELCVGGIGVGALFNDPGWKRQKYLFRIDLISQAEVYRTGDWPDFCPTEILNSGRLGRTDKAEGLPNRTGRNRSSLRQNEKVGEADSSP